MFNVYYKYLQKWIIIKCDQAVLKTDENIHTQSSSGSIKSNKRTQGPSCKNKPSLSGGLEDGDCLLIEEGGRALD